MRRWAFQWWKWVWGRVASVNLQSASFVRRKGLVRCVVFCFLFFFVTAPSALSCFFVVFFSLFSPMSSSGSIHLDAHLFLPLLWPWCVHAGSENQVLLQSHCPLPRLNRASDNDAGHFF